ncbi:hypothetical protein DACRYDRAFT_15015 [Dacryopinax primogenitus]|uniref:Uncharacterized protein n=1 Tax=Dacryopinax primogenitus (strain DJM 731) TaxID=1858805 RepID=M5G4D9_DACPD|nr:uncharacterized protein DACRYDRAFT_15015 [Dacryopinax primogenitus]EJU03095.1 hypothetical protein DACRYDRAFT_15015 [Dacryopinax primogenitus]
MPFLDLDRVDERNINSMLDHEMSTSTDMSDDDGSSSTGSSDDPAPEYEESISDFSSPSPTVRGTSPTPLHKSAHFPGKFPKSARKTARAAHESLRKYKSHPKSEMFDDRVRAWEESDWSDDSPVHSRRASFTKELPVVHRHRKLRPHTRESFRFHSECIKGTTRTLVEYEHSEPGTMGPFATKLFELEAAATTVSWLWGGAGGRVGRAGGPLTRFAELSAAKKVFWNRERIAAFFAGGAAVWLALGSCAISGC